MGDSNKQKDIHADDNHIENIIDSDELFDLDMPLDEPDNIQEDALTGVQDDILEEPDAAMQTITPASENAELSEPLQDLMDEFSDHDLQDSETGSRPDEEQETLLTVEQDLEHLLDRSDSHGEDEFEPASQPINADITDVEKNAANITASTLAEPVAEMPVPEKTNAKPRFGMASSFIITLGLIAILIASLAGWLGLDASQQKSNLASVSSNLQQQINLLEQQQEQQNSLLTQHIETLEKRLNTLTQVIANKTAEQWRASVQQAPAIHAEKPAPAYIQTASQKPTRKPAPKPKQPVTQASANKKKNNNTAKQAITPSTVTETPTAAVKYVAKPAATSPQLSMYEVAPGTVKGWVVNIYSAGSKSTAERRIRQLKVKKIDAKFVRVQVKGKTWYRVRASGFKDERSAITFKKFLKEYHGIEAWHSYRK